MEPAIRVAEIHFQSRSEQLRRVRDEVRAVCRKYVCSAECLDHIVIAINEACSNVIEHAYGKECSAEIVLKIFNEQDRLVFRLIDHADRTEPDCLNSRRPDIRRPGGFGVFIINEVMDEVHFLECPPGDGNILEMKKTVE